MKIADYFYYQPDLQWDYAKQLGIRYAVGRMPDGNMECHLQVMQIMLGLNTSLVSYHRKGWLVLLWQTVQ